MSRDSPDPDPSARTGPWQQVWSRQLDDSITALDWSPDGALLAGVDRSGRTSVLDGAGRSVFGRVDEDEAMLAVRWDPSGTWLATGSRLRSGGRVHVWDRRLGVTHRGAVPGWAHTLCWGRRGLLAASAGRHVALLDRRARIRRLVEAGSGLVNALAWLEPATLAIAGAEGVRTLGESDACAALTWPSVGTTLGLRASPCGSVLGTAEASGSLRVLTRSGYESEMSGYPDPVRLLSWDHHGRRLATAADDEVTVWEVGPEGFLSERPTSLVAGDDPVEDLAFQPAGPLLATSQGPGVTVWVPGYAESPVAAFDVGDVAHRIAWRPDGGRLAVGCEDGTVSVLEVGPWSPW